MQTAKIIQFALVPWLILMAPTLVQATTSSLTNKEYEEVSYDDLLNELSAKKRNFTAVKHSSFDDVRLHTGIGYSNSLTNINAQNQNLTRFATGIQLSVGMDLFSPNWYSEGVFRNYGLTTLGTEEMSLREIDLKVGYTNNLEGIWSYSLSTGLSNRFLRFSDPSQNIDIDDTTPSLAISSGFIAQIHKNVSLGAELSARSAIINRTSDKSSLDFALRLNTSL